MSLSKELKRLYEEYDRIQGDDPICMSRFLIQRIENRHYKAPIMKQIVGLMREFVAAYETDDCGRNTKYVIAFQFDRRYDLAYTGPYMAVLDFIEEKCVCVVCWNGGKIEKLCANDTDLTQWYKDYPGLVETMRHRCGLASDLRWKPLECSVEQYDIPWKEIDETGELSPICGLDAVSANQIAKYLQVPVSYILQCVRHGYDNSPFRIGEFGITYANADELALKVSGSVRDKSGADLPLENGKTICVPNSATQYFSRCATAWAIETIKNQPDFFNRQKMVTSRGDKAEFESHMDEYRDHTWEQLCTDRAISPIRGIDVVSKQQVIEYLGVSEYTMKRRMASLKEQLEQLGMFTITSKLIAEQADEVVRNADNSYEARLENGEWTHLPIGKYTYFSAAAVAWLAENVKKTK